MSGEPDIEFTGRERTHLEGLRASRNEMWPDTCPVCASIAHKLEARQAEVESAPAGSGEKEPS